MEPDLDGALGVSSAVVFPESGGDAIIRNLKRPALLFETIHVLHLSGLTALLDKINSESDLPLKAELEWLLDRGMIVPVNFKEFTDPFGGAAEHYPNVIPD